MEAPREIFEAKYTLPRRSRDHVLSILRQRTDVPVEFPYAKVRTIYFDDRGHSSYYDSIDGQLDKRKFRLREYLDSEGGARYSFEVKVRDNTKTSKVRELVFEGLPEGYRFTTFADLLDTLERITGRAMPGMRVEAAGRELFADTTIFYERFRFDDRYEDARYNVDTSVLLVPGVRSHRDSDEGICLDHDIFEIKSPVPRALPPYLAGFGVEPVSFSKFVWGKDLFF